MNKQTLGKIIFTIVVSALVVGLTTSVFAQGRGGGGGRGSGGGGGRGSAGGGGGNAGGPPSGTGVDRGLGNASDRSNGRSDRGLDKASSKSQGRSDAGLERARAASNNLRHADEDLRAHPGIVRTLHTNANDLRSGYQTALATNPNLKFGHFVSATRVSQNLGARNPAITREAILNGLASGRSLGQTLQDLGLSEREANEAKKQAEREIKRSRN
jgi:hypothetical protein